MSKRAAWVTSVCRWFASGWRRVIRRGGRPDAVVDGEVGFKDGQFRITDPKGGGLPAVLIPGEDVLLTVDGRPVTEPVAVVTSQHPAVRPRLSAEPVRRFEIRVDPDRMTAYLVTERLGPPGYRVRNVSPGHVIRLSTEALPGLQAVPTVEAVERALHDAGVVMGIDRDAIRRTLEAADAKSVAVARGRPAQPGIPGRVDMKAGTPAHDDPFGLSLRIEAGDVIAELIRPREGVPGYDVLGNVVPPPPVERCELAAGHGAELTQDGTEAIATIPGRPVLIEVFPYVCRATVVPQVQLSGSLVQGKTHYRFDGDVVIDGDIDGRGVTLEAGGWIWVRGSVFGASLEAGQGIRVDGSVQWSRLTTRATRRRLIPLLEQCGRVLTELRQLREYANLIRVHPRYAELSRSCLFGEIMLRLAEQQLDWLVQEVRKARGALADLPLLRTQVDLDAILDTLERQVRAGSMGGVGDLTRYIEAISAAMWRAVDILGAGGHDAPIHARTLVGSEADADGGVILHGAGAEQSVIRARGPVRAASLRDAYVKSSTAIDVDTVAALTRDSALLEVAPGGRIRVGEARREVRLKVGEWTHVLDPDTWSAMVRSERGGRISMSSGRIHMDGPIPVLRFLESESEGELDVT